MSATARTGAAPSAAVAVAVAEAVPAGTRLLHVGPHKTGTTAVQNALWSARSSLLAHGVRHAGRSRNPAAAVLSVVERPSPYSVDQSPPIKRWDQLVREITAAGEDRVITSSEFFAWASDDAIRRIAADLDATRLHVIVTMRPLARVIPSMWQQNVQQGATATIDDWVRGILENRSAPFWRLERQDQLLERWAAVVGKDRVTGIVIDEREHGFVMRAFESLLGVPEGILTAERELMNRSLTLPEAEAVRAFNVAFKAADYPRDFHARVMRFGAAQLMKERVPPDDEPAVRLPTWAFDELSIVQAEVIANVRSLGVRIVGDLDRLSPAPPASTPTTGQAASEDLARPGIPPDIVGSITMALLTSTGAVRQAAVSRGPFKFAEPAEMTRVPTYQVFGALAGRIWRKVAGRVPVPMRKTSG
jgi:hypothetical protein